MANAIITKYSGIAPPLAGIQLTPYLPKKNLEFVEPVNNKKVPIAPIEQFFPK